MTASVIVIDQGSHSSRALVFDSAGNVLATASVVIKTEYPQIGFVEQSPAVIFSSVILALQKLEKLLTPQQIDCIISAALIVQRSSMLACDQSLNPLTPVISWQDTRNQALVDKLWPYEKIIKDETGLRVNAHYGASKMRWLLDNDKAVQEAAANANLLFVPLAAFIACRLVNTSQCVVDPVIASRTLLSALGSCEWSDTMLRLFDIDKHCLPRIVPSDFHVGNFAFASKNIPLTLVGGDQSFIAFACGVPINPDTAYVNIGTGAFVQMLDKNQNVESDLLCSPLFISEDEKIIVAEGTVNAAATALDWLWETAGEQLEYQVMERAMLSQHKPPVFINTLAGTGSPYWLSVQAPYFIGEATLLEKAIAVFESIVFALMDNLQILLKKNPNLGNIIVGGGLSQSDGFCQKLANLSGLPVARPAMHEISARGAALYLLQKPQADDDLKRHEFQPARDALLRKRYEKYVGYMQAYSKKAG